MKRIPSITTLLGAAALVLLAGCHSVPDPPRVTVSADTSTPVTERRRFFVVEYFSANFAANGRLFQDQFAALARSCQVSVEFFPIPPVADRLTLDPSPEIGWAQGELRQRLGISQPDAILEVQTAGWHSSGGLPPDPSAPLTYGSFDIELRLIDGRTRSNLWRASGELNVRGGAGGELLAGRTMHLLAMSGALPHCP